MGESGKKEGSKEWLLCIRGAKKVREIKIRKERGKEGMVIEYQRKKERKREMEKEQQKQDKHLGRK